MTSSPRPRQALGSDGVPRAHRGHAGALARRRRRLRRRPAGRLRRRRRVLRPAARGPGHRDPRATGAEYITCAGLPFGAAPTGIALSGLERVCERKREPTPRGRAGSSPPRGSSSGPRWSRRRARSATRGADDARLSRGPRVLRPPSWPSLSPSTAIPVAGADRRRCSAHARTSWPSTRRCRRSTGAASTRATSRRARTA